MNTNPRRSVTPSSPVSPMASSMAPAETGGTASEPEAMARPRRVLGARLPKMRPLSFTE